MATDLSLHCLLRSVSLSKYGSYKERISSFNVVNHNALKSWFKGPNLFHHENMPI